MSSDGRGAGANPVPVSTSGARGSVQPLPGPAPRPFGLPPDDFDRDPVASLARLRGEYGDVYAFGAGKVALARPEWARWVLAHTNRETLVDPPEPPRAVQRRGLVRDNVETWMATKRTAQWHRLGRDIAERTVPGIRLHLEQFLDRAEHAAIRMRDCERVLLDAAGAIFIRDLEGDLRAKMIRAAALLIPQGMSSIAPPAWLSLWTHRRIRANDAMIEALLAHVASRRASRNPDEPPSDLLDLLLDARDDDGPAFTDLDVAQTLSINLGNLYTVGGAGLAWLLAAHGAHDFARPETTSREDWARAVVKETLRAYPPVALTSRVLVEDREFGDYTVSADNSVFISPLLFHTDPRWWREDPSRFDPARWLADKVHEPHAYLPYGAGPRMCTGVHISNAVLETAADLLDGRTVTSRSGPIKPQWDAIARPRRFRVRVGRDESARHRVRP